MKNQQLSREVKSALKEVRRKQYLGGLLTRDEYHKMLLKIDSITS